MHPAVPYTKISAGGKGYTGACAERCRVLCPDADPAGAAINFTIFIIYILTNIKFGIIVWVDTKNTTTDKEIRAMLHMPNVWWLPGGEELEQDLDREDIPYEYEIIPDDDLPFN